MKSKLFIMILLITSLVACGQKDNHDHSSNLTGKQLFSLHCAVCHTDKGTGQILLGVPANKDTSLTDLQIRNKIQHGQGDNSKMEVFATMPDKEAIKIIRHLRSLGHSE